LAIIGEIVGTWLGLTGAAAVVAGSLVAIAGAMMVSRLINGSPGNTGSSTANEQGTRQQLQPDTGNKIPVLYGSAYCNGIITDAYLDNNNQTMTYIMAISETTESRGNVTADYTVEDIYWNDLRLVFDNTDPSKVVSGKKNVADPDPAVEDYTDNNFDGKVYISVYAGGAAANNKILGKNQTAKDAVNRFVKEGDPLHWNDGTYNYTNLVFAVVQVNYDSSKGFTGLPTITFKIKNSMDNPGEILYDYLTTERYGAGIPDSEIDIDSLDTLYDFANEYVAYTPVEPDSTTMGDFVIGNHYKITSLGNTTQANWNTLAGTTGHTYHVNDVIIAAATGTGYGTGLADNIGQKRYTLNGLIDTSRSCRDNIETISLNCGTWVSYNVERGQWRAIAKTCLPGTTWSGQGRTGDPTDPQPDIILTDDHIIGGMNISSTKLDNLYNAADITFYDRNNRDTRGFQYVDLADIRPDLINANEPTNALRLQLDLTNNNVQAERLANLELKQSRDDLVVTFTTTYYGLQLQAGDVVGIYQPQPYGWYDTAFPYGKYFRVLSTREIEDGYNLKVEITAIEYNADVYADENITEFYTKRNIGIPPNGGDENYPAPIVEIRDVNNNTGTPNFGIKVKVPSTGGPYDLIEVRYAEGDDFAGYGADISFVGATKGNQLAVTDVSSLERIRAGHRLRGYYTDKYNNVYNLDWQGTGAAGIYIIGPGDGNISAPGNGGVGSYTLSEVVDPPVPYGTRIYTTYRDAKLAGRNYNNTLTVDNVYDGDIGTSVDGKRFYNNIVEEEINGGYFQGSIAGDVLTVSALKWGNLQPPQPPFTGYQHYLYISGTGITSGTYVTQQIIPLQAGETQGGKGRYRLNAAYTAAVSSTAIRSNWAYPGLMIKKGLTGSGGTGTYQTNYVQSLGGSPNPGLNDVNLITKYSYPDDESYKFLTYIRPDSNTTTFFLLGEIRVISIFNLPANGDDKKYFIKCRMGNSSTGIFGPWSDLNEVDLEVPHVYWDPSNSGALQIKAGLLRMDFGKLEIPNNGFWLMKTAQVLDFGSINNVRARHNLDLGLLDVQENVVDNGTDFEGFVYQDKPE
jgi:hypothetical protein